MSDQAAGTQVVAPVRYAVTVPLPADRAFALFTNGFNSWWPGHHIGTAEMGPAAVSPVARVDRVDAGRMHGHPHLARPWDRISRPARPQLLRAAELADQHGSHSGPFRCAPV